MKMLRIGYSELRYLDTMKTMCSFLDRIFSKKDRRGISREVKYGSGQFHYIEKVGDFQTYSFSDKSPLDVMKEITERANERWH